MEHHSQNHNLQLNRDKCKLLVTNDDGVRVRFTDGTLAQKVDPLLYLGAWFHKSLDVSFILRRKPGKARGVMRQLKLIWKTRRCTIPWKLRVFNAVIRSKLFYSMETMVLTISQQKTLDTFFYRALRRILSSPSTYVVRQWPHARVLRRAQHLAKHPRHPNICKGPIPFSTYYQNRRIKLLGHLLRANDNDLTKAAVILSQWHRFGTLTSQTSWKTPDSRG